MEVKTNKPEISLTLDNKARLTFTVPKALITEIEELNDDITLIVKNYHSKRTLTQNAYMWSMINKLAVKVNETCENVYKSFIRDYGVRDFLLVKDSSVKDFIDRWNKKGIGWFCEEVRKGKVDGTTANWVEQSIDLNDIPCRIFIYNEALHRFFFYTEPGVYYRMTLRNFDVI